MILGRMEDELPKESKEGRVNAKVAGQKACEVNVCNGALHVVGLHEPGDKISLFLQDRELAKVALSCHMARDMHEAW